eukprot:CAMPEP_0197588506 /NCGR_PEP_ID=MMETSP1326-20131121/9767_1 /TAXON_ID=1155430 /ORGANISM="Genus nov. species nov., Strain RCC2288" /LENGTH=211 /DNA_ID=CAMNT_0043153345 /DNA_START=65 /DNA_END=700 /DNA_ORIENTATION=-
MSEAASSATTAPPATTTTEPQPSSPPLPEISLLPEEGGPAVSSEEKSSSSSSSSSLPQPVSEGITAAAAAAVESRVASDASDIVGDVHSWWQAVLCCGNAARPGHLSNSSGKSIGGKVKGARDVDSDEEDEDEEEDKARYDSSGSRSPCHLCGGVQSLSRGWALALCCQEPTRRSKSSLSRSTSITLEGLGGEGEKGGSPTSNSNPLKAEE